MAWRSLREGRTASGHNAKSTTYRAAQIARPSARHLFSGMDFGTVLYIFRLRYAVFGLGIEAQTLLQLDVICGAREQAIPVEVRNERSVGRIAANALKPHSIETLEGIAILALLRIVAPRVDKAQDFLEARNNESLFM